MRHFSSCISARRPGHITAGEHMEMQMEHALSRLFANIGDHAETFQPHVLCNFGNHFKAVRYDCTVGGIHRSDRLDMLLGDDQKMRRCLRVDVVKGIALLVLIDFFSREFPLRRFYRTDNPAY